MDRSSCECRKPFLAPFRQSWPEWSTDRNEVPLYGSAICSQEHIDQLKGNIRESDHLEVEAAIGWDADYALQWSFDRAEMCWAGLLRGRCVLVWGVCRPSILSNSGVPWLLAAKEMESEPFAVLRESKRFVNEMMREFSYLENYVDARHEVSIKWLKWCGFNIEPAQPFGIYGLPFHHFWKRREI